MGEPPAALVTRSWPCSSRRGSGARNPGTRIWLTSTTQTDVRRSSAPGSHWTRRMPENGCMMVIPGSHHEGPMPHWTRRDWQICDTDVRVGESRRRALGSPGGCLLFHCLLHHGSTADALGSDGAGRCSFIIARPAPLACPDNEASPARLRNRRQRRHLLGADPREKP